MFLQLSLNLSLLFGMLIAPSLLLVSVWYRRSLGKTVFAWNRHEMVVLTIVFSVIALIHLIIGISCLFSYWGYLDPVQIQSVDRTAFLRIGIICATNILGMVICYFALRRLLVQLVLPRGIVLNRMLVPMSNRLHVLDWDNIADYYVVSDYPNAVFTFISKTSEFRYERNAIRVPIYLKEDFQDYIDLRLSGISSQEESEIGSRFLSEN